MRPSRLRLQIRSDQVKKTYITDRKPLAAQISRDTVLVAKNVGR